MMAATDKKRSIAEEQQALLACVVNFRADDPKDRQNTTRARQKAGKLSGGGVYGPHDYGNGKLQPGGQEFNRPHTVVGVCLYGLLPKRPQDWLSRTTLDQVGLAGLINYDWPETLLFEITVYFHSPACQETGSSGGGGLNKFL